MDTWKINHQMKWQMHLFEGAKEMIGPAIMIGFARGIIVIAENANIIDTILYNLSSAIGSYHLYLLHM
mgnify:CR=1 FL=1